VGSVERLKHQLGALCDDRAGTRLTDLRQFAELLSEKGAVGSIASSVIGNAAKPVRAILFNKSDATNWALDWHQDRTICVRDRREVPGFGPWTIKQGLPHVAPPVDILAGMVTLRVHLDPVEERNAPLLIAPGSHLFGRVEEKRIPELVRKCGTSSCLAESGDVWLYATLILHASERSKQPQRRRVLQLDYSASDLPGELQWPTLI
jgi:ectoine hydroxylase-related dioxygenase (phytanoyl-CoA dioxygenase family)